MRYINLGLTYLLTYCKAAQLNSYILPGSAATDLRGGGSFIYVFSADPF